MKKALFIEGNRNGYGPDQCGNTFTIRELIEHLEECANTLGDDTEIFLRNDNGYTYGSINDYDFNSGKYDSRTTELDECFGDCVYDCEEV